MHSIDQLPVVVIGAGPVGLAAAAHLLARDLSPIVLEAGPDIASSVRSWSHVRLFSPWRYDIDRAAQAMLEQHGWTAPPPDALPTGHDLVELYLRPLSRLPQVAAALRLDARVVAITRLGRDKIKTAGREGVPFVVRTRSSGGVEQELLASAVIDVSGTWGNPNPLGASGLPALGEQAHADRIHYGIPDILGRDRQHYDGRTTLVVGAGHSAANSILALVDLESEQTRVVWATRGSNLARVYGGSDADGLPERGRLGDRLRSLVKSGRLELVTDFRIGSVGLEHDKVIVRGQGPDGEVVLRGIERIIAATGQRPDLGVARELRVETDPALESVRALGPLIDPNEHSCGSVRPHGEAELRQPEPNYYVVGSKSYGRAPTFLLATGYEQVRSVVAHIAGDHEAARRVELDLPETGVCSSRPSPGAGGCSTVSSPGAGGCCAPAAPKPASSCCGPALQPRPQPHSACC
ncbi:MAG: FAD-dependent oxidoreductase [Pseudomonadota bacterium]|nr:FAD-dependent oxidoreductase [Pseudomonadota bacterium]